MKESSLVSKAKEYFKGRIIYKPHIRNLYLSEQVPGYVLEYLFRKFCPQGYSPEGINKIKEVREIFQIPEENEAIISVIIGYPKYKYKRTIKRNIQNINWIE